MAYEKNENNLKAGIGALLTDAGPDLDIDPSEVAGELFNVVDSVSRRGKFRHNVLDFADPTTLNIGEVMVSATQVAFHEIDLRAMNIGSVLVTEGSNVIEFNDELGRVWYRTVDNFVTSGSPGNLKYIIETSTVTESDVAALPQAGSELIINLRSASSAGLPPDTIYSNDGLLSGDRTVSGTGANFSLSFELLSQFKIDVEGELRVCVNDEELISQNGITVNTELEFPGFPGRNIGSTVGSGSIVGGFLNDGSGYGALMMSGMSEGSGNYSGVFGENLINRGFAGLVRGFDSENYVPYGTAIGVEVFTGVPGDEAGLNVFSSFGGGRFVKSRGQGTFAYGNGINNGGDKKYIIASGYGAINMSSVNGSYPDEGSGGVGVEANFGVNLGGINNTIPAGSSGSINVGGSNVTIIGDNIVQLGIENATITDTEGVYLRNLRIWDAVAQDDSLNQLLAYNPSTKKVDYVDKASLGGASNTIYTADDTITSNRKVNGGGFNLSFENVNDFSVLNSGKVFFDGSSIFEVISNGMITFDAQEEIRLETQDEIILDAVDEIRLLSNNQIIGNAPSYNLTADNSFSLVQSSGGVDGILNLNNGNFQIISEIAATSNSQVALNEDNLLLGIDIGGNSAGVTFGATGHKVIDFVGNTGLAYAGNYDANGVLDDNWIPSYRAVKAYSDSNSTLQSILANGSSATFTSSNLTTINITQGDGNGIFGFDFDGFATQITDNNLNQATLINSSSDRIFVGYNDTSTGDTSQLEITPSIIEFKDNVNSKGAVYNADYSALGVLDDRWIPDYKAVKDYADSVVSNTSTEHDDIFTINVSGAWVVRTLPAQYQNKLIFVAIVANSEETAGIREENTLNDRRIDSADDGTAIMPVKVNSLGEIEVYASDDDDVEFKILSAL